MNYSEIAYKIINNILRLTPGQTIMVSAEIHNVEEHDDPLVEIPFLEELALSIRKYKGLPIIDISTENLHKRFFEEVYEEDTTIAVNLFYKWLESADIFIDLAWRSNPIFYKSIPDRNYKRLTVVPAELLTAFEKTGKKLILLGYPTKSLANYLDIDDVMLKQAYIESLNTDYHNLKKRAVLLDWKMKKARIWNVITDNRNLSIELIQEPKSLYGDIGEDSVIILPTGSWLQDINKETLSGMFYCDCVYHDKNKWENIQIIFENGRITDVETDSDQKNLNLLKSILFFDIESVQLNIGLNKEIKQRTGYKLFDMIKNKTLSLLLKTQRGQVILLSERAQICSSDNIDILSEGDI